jgi:hypothetical protein
VNRFATILACIPIVAGCGGTTRNDPPIPDVAPVAAGERVENPAYASWAPFPVGTVVVRRSVTEEIGRPETTTTISTFVLLEKTDDRLVLELKTHTTRYDGFVIDNPPDRLSTDRYFHLPPGAKRTEARGDGKDETVKVKDRPYPSRVVESRDRNEGGVVEVRTWSSKAMPGGLVKSVSETPGVRKRTTIEVSDVRIPG